jgi:arsenate reductase (thioredoxin)
MRMATDVAGVLIVALWAAGSGGAWAGEADLIETVRPYVAGVVGEFERISGERRAVLDEVAAFIAAGLKERGEAKLTFICTHNSRRSHLAQIWAQAAALHYGLDGVKSFSGGTEATAFNIRTVRALRRAGFSVVDSTGGTNPVYLVQYAEGAPPIRAFSKVYDAEGNPKEGFAAMMCCDQADANCPLVNGATTRVPVHYEDPKKGDGTPGEASGYDERCRQIAGEMFYLMSRVRK